MSHKFFYINCSLCNVWIGCCDYSNAEYFYGGTRLIEPSSSQEELKHSLKRLMLEESQLKNILINRALSNTTIFADIKQELS